MDRRSSRLAAMVVLVAGVLSGPACNKDAGTKSGDPADESIVYAVATAPDSLLQNFLHAYSVRDAAGYVAILADDFSFTFSDIDQQDPDVPSDILGREMEALIHERMLESDRVQTITLSSEYDGSLLEFDELRSTETDSLWTLLLTDFDFYMYGATPMHPDETMAYEVVRGVLQVWFRETDEIDPAGGERLWRVALFKEHNFGGRGKPGESATWGMIKSRFSEPWPDPD